MRGWRRPPGLGFDGELSRRAHAPVRNSPRTGCRGAALAGQLPGAEARRRGDLRAQPSSAASGRCRKAEEEVRMIEMRRSQLSFGDGLIAEEVSDLREAWMRHADEVLADEHIVAAVYEALAQRHPQSRSRGRRGSPADMVLRLLILKHVRNWSYGVLEREVRANLVYRDFTRVGGAKMPDAKTMGRWGVALGPTVLKQIHERVVTIAQDRGVAAGRRMRVDTTVVETNIHHPTDSTLLGDGVRVLTRTMRKITAIARSAPPPLPPPSR